ncbi:zinc ribbon domain-containing protein [Haloferax sp. MBLA0076]|uniref:Zinc ribbon domain-containing protein n=1 Tax=Haloferax litoreum TaxID=2666140 RepID=A0A6A8GK80_9EURY|nr:MULTISPECIES: zinc ribbon domain-containing protein [Haloferax]KAB1193922.1 zinc ribbon domain-containing protein [Haloferax sp. CBA1148]MRX22467.1 zinc ribbon domain-containing protein [Haloferax litoreum]
MSGLSKVRPWLAAILGLAVTGLGHLYLRRWRRAALWVALAFAISVFFVPTGAVESLATGGEIPPLVDVLPVLAVSLVSVLDAFLLGMKQVSEPSGTAVIDESEAVSCPQCGRDVDPDLDFCHWCTTRLDEQRDD